MMGWFDRFGKHKIKREAADQSPQASVENAADDAEQTVNSPTPIGVPVFQDPSAALPKMPEADGRAPRPPATPAFEKDNRGIRIRRLEQAEPYYRWRSDGQLAPGFLIYRFGRERDAQEALLSLDAFHLAQDTGNLICDLALVFGWYRRSDGSWEVLLGGEALTPGQWITARQSLEKSGGSPVDHRRPSRGSPPDGSLPSFGSVTFVREYSVVDLSGTRRYRVFRASSSMAARRFLKQKESRPDRPSEVVQVETPEGVFHRDHTGLIEEIDAE